MYESWTEIAVLLRNFLGFIWDLSDVFTAHICSTRVQMQYLKSIFEGWFLESVVFKLFFNDNEKCIKNILQ